MCWRQHRIKANYYTASNCFASRWLRFVAVAFRLTSKIVVGHGLFASVQQSAWFWQLDLPMLLEYFFLYSWSLLRKAVKEQVRPHVYWCCWCNSCHFSAWVVKCLYSQQNRVPYGKLQILLYALLKKKPRKTCRRFSRPNLRRTAFKENIYKNKTTP